MIVAPSILSIDFKQFKEQLQQVNQSAATWIHFDVMDGHFVPNLTFGPDILKSVKELSDLFMDVHLMVNNPEVFVDMFVAAGCDQITFHLEATNDHQRTLDLINKIKQNQLKVGITIKPNTPKEAIDPYVSMVDLILIMSVEPGFGGQSFIMESLDKIRYAKQLIREVNSHALVQVDGGINDETVKLVKEAGADVVVAGSYIFKQNIIKAVESLC
jgi:ribulose-phosphate 3-epimerase